jgi:hypothetical protein
MRRLLLVQVEMKLQVGAIGAMGQRRFRQVPVLAPPTPAINAQNVSIPSPRLRPGPTFFIGFAGSLDQLVEAVPVHSRRLSPILV